MSDLTIVYVSQLASWKGQPPVRRILILSKRSAAGLEFLLP